jgi:hypothetical protein
MDWPPEDPAFTEAQLGYFLYKNNPLQCSVIVADVRIPPMRTGGNGLVRYVFKSKYLSLKSIESLTPAVEAE